jgi:hypothetical protein
VCAAGPAWNLHAAYKNMPGFQPRPPDDGTGNPAGLPVNAQPFIQAADLRLTPDLPTCYLVRHDVCTIDGSNYFDRTFAISPYSCVPAADNSGNPNAPGIGEPGNRTISNFAINEYLTVNNIGIDSFWCYGTTYHASGLIGPAMQHRVTFDCNLSSPYTWQDLVAETETMLDASVTRSLPLHVVDLAVNDAPNYPPPNPYFSSDALTHRVQYKEILGIGYTSSGFWGVNAGDDFNAAMEAAYPGIDGFLVATEENDPDWEINSIILAQINLEVIGRLKRSKLEVRGCSGPSRKYVFDLAGFANQTCENWSAPAPLVTPFVNIEVAANGNNLISPIVIQEAGTWTSRGVGFHCGSFCP